MTRTRINESMQYAKERDDDDDDRARGCYDRTPDTDNRNMTTILTALLFPCIDRVVAVSKMSVSAVVERIVASAERG